jgi:hypothetical protein
MDLLNKARRLLSRIERGRYRGDAKTRKAERRHNRLERRIQRESESLIAAKVRADVAAFAASGGLSRFAAARSAPSAPLEIVLVDVVSRAEAGLPPGTGFYGREHHPEVRLYGIERRSS